MSEQNVEVVRLAIEAVVRGDMEAALAGLDPDIAITDLDTTLDSAHHRGHDGFLQWLSVWNEPWESWRLEDVEILPVGEEHVIALFVTCAVGKGSSIELERSDAITYKLRDGKTVELAYYNDQQQARDAVGLRE